MEPGDSKVTESIVLQMDRNLKWKALDILEWTLMVICGVCITGFTLGVFLDVVTRSIGHPWLWLQEVTISFFVYGIFLGMAVAVRRNQHITLAEGHKKYTGIRRIVHELFIRLVVLIVAICLIYFGYLNYLMGFGSFLMPSMTPIAVLYAAIPISGILVALFTIEQAVNGVKYGFHTTSVYEAMVLEAMDSDSNDKGVAG